MDSTKNITSKSFTLDVATMADIAKGNVLGTGKVTGKTEVHKLTVHADAPMSVMTGSQLKGNLRTTKIGGDTISSRGATSPKTKGR